MYKLDNVGSYVDVEWKKICTVNAFLSMIVYHQCFIIKLSYKIMYYAINHIMKIITLKRFRVKKKYIQENGYKLNIYVAKDE